MSILDGAKVAAVSCPTMMGIVLGSVLTLEGKWLYVCEQVDGSIFIGSRKALAILETVAEGNKK